jgi:hypothetical protein
MALNHVRFRRYRSVSSSSPFKTCRQPSVGATVVCTRALLQALAEQQAVEDFLSGRSEVLIYHGTMPRGVRPEGCEQREAANPSAAVDSPTTSTEWLWTQSPTPLDAFALMISGDSVGNTSPIGDASVALPASSIDRRSGGLDPAPTQQRRAFAGRSADSPLKLLLPVCAVTYTGHRVKSS